MIATMKGSRDMHRIETKAEFFHWIATAIRAAGDQVHMPVGLLRSYHDIFRHMGDEGSFSIGAERSAWAISLGALVDSARQRLGKTEAASAAVSYFLGDVYTRATVRKGTLTQKAFIRAVRGALKLEPMDLRIEDRVLRSSPEFDRRFSRQIRVPLPRKPAKSEQVARFTRWRKEPTRLLPRNQRRSSSG